MVCEPQACDLLGFLSNNAVCARQQSTHHLTQPKTLCGWTASTGQCGSGHGPRRGHPYPKAQRKAQNILRRWRRRLFNIAIQHRSACVHEVRKVAIDGAKTSVRALKAAANLCQHSGDGDSPVPKRVSRRL